MSDCRICIVEKDEIEAEILSSILAVNGDVEIFTSGEEFLSTMHCDKPVLVVMETHLPGISGYDVCRGLKEDFTCESCVLFLSSHNSVEERMRGLDAGAEDYLSKPYDVLEISAKISSAKDRIENRISMKEQLDYASNTAFQAMSAQSEMGTVLRAVSALNEATEHAAVDKALFDCLGELDLTTAVFYNGAHNEEIYVAPQGRGVSPIEQQIIKLVRPVHRIWKKGNRAMFNFHNSSLLVLNMPEDEERAGRHRDTLCLLMEVYDARIASVNSLMQLTDAKKWRADVAEITRLLEQASGQLQQSTEDNNKGSKDLLYNLAELMPRLGLEEDQEESINVILDDATEKFEASSVRSQKIAAVFSEVLGRLKNMV